MAQYVLPVYFLLTFTLAQCIWGNHTETQVTTAKDRITHTVSNPLTSTISPPQSYAPQHLSAGIATEPSLGRTSACVGLGLQCTRQSDCCPGHSQDSLEVLCKVTSSVTEFTGTSNVLGLKSDLKNRQQKREVNSSRLLRENSNGRFPTEENTPGFESVFGSVLDISNTTEANHGADNSGNRTNVDVSLEESIGLMANSIPGQVERICCVRNRERCYHSSECCSGNCDGSTMECMDKCAANGVHCNTGEECCSGTCRSSSCCVSTLKKCTQDHQCCTGHCSKTPGRSVNEQDNRIIEGTCCREEHKRCTQDKQCCSGDCVLVNGKGTCRSSGNRPSRSNRPFQTWLGGCLDRSCGADSDCCSGSICGRAGKCVSAVRCRASQQSCKRESECCDSGASCVPQYLISSNAKIPPGTQSSLTQAGHRKWGLEGRCCRVWESQCNSGSECCSRRCREGKCCSAEGSRCDKNRPCCQPFVCSLSGRCLSHGIP